MLSILHIASDEKFINAANYLFEKAFPGSNHFIIPKSRFQRDFKYVKPGHNVERVYFGKNLKRKLARKAEKFDCVFIHSISEFNSSVFLLSEAKNKFVGILWGAELYTEENFRRSNLLGKLTSEIVLPEPAYSRIENIKRIIRKFIYGKEESLMDATKNAALNLKYLCFPFDEEFKLFRDLKLISEDCRQVLFSYYPLQYIIRGAESVTADGNDILVGNSASASNNHLEAFEILKDLDTGDRRIIVPLSYGDSFYADFIEKTGSSVFGSKFIPLRRFLALDDYTRLIKACGIVIMNHYRQQALGTVLVMLYMGGKVFLSESNTIYKYLNRIGVKVFSIESELNHNNQAALTNLSPADMEKNRSILREFMSEDKIIERMKAGLTDFIA